MLVHLCRVFLLFESFQWLVLFLFGIVILIFQMALQHLIFWHILLYILVFPFYGSLLFAFQNRSLWWFCVFVSLNSICSVQGSVYILHNCYRVFLFCLFFLELCIIPCILQKSVSSFLLGIWMHLIHNCIQNCLCDRDFRLIFQFFL